MLQNILKRFRVLFASSERFGVLFASVIYSMYKIYQAKWTSVLSLSEFFLPP